MLEIFKCLLLFFSPAPYAVIFGEVGQWSGDIRISFNEFLNVMDIGRKLIVLRGTTSTNASILIIQMQTHNTFVNL